MHLSPVSFISFAAVLTLVRGSPAELGERAAPVRGVKKAAVSTAPVLVKTYQGATFFDSWYWAEYSDPTHGSVNFVNQTYAKSHRMANAPVNGSVTISMDRFTNIPASATAQRNSIRISSLDSYNVGTLAIVDLAHIPYGPGVWPAFWMCGPNWPNSGEIDIVEQVNSVNTNQAALHTGPGCSFNASVPQAGTGSTHPNCDSSATGSGLGCSVSDPSDISFGKGFATHGGGVWATQWNSTGIFIYRWTRTAIPADITSGSPNPASWGVPFAAWSDSGCNYKTQFADMALVFDITLCGDWAGSPYVWPYSGAPSQYQTCQSAVGDPTLFTQAYFSVNYLKMYTVPI
ncbi:hypothetical protein RQP46_008268 [Phenoliferia psychrophenolica]